MNMLQHPNSWWIVTLRCKFWLLQRSKFRWLVIAWMSESGSFSGTRPGTANNWELVGWQPWWIWPKNTRATGPSTDHNLSYCKCCRSCWVIWSEAGHVLLRMPWDGKHARDALHWKNPAQLWSMARHYRLVITMVMRSNLNPSKPLRTHIELVWVWWQSSVLLQYTWDNLWLIEDWFIWKKLRRSWLVIIFGGGAGRKRTKKRCINSCVRRCDRSQCLDVWE